MTPDTPEAIRANVQAKLAAIVAERAARDAADPAAPVAVIAVNAAPARGELHPVLVRLADVQPEAVTWLWPGRLAAGNLALLVGDPGLGKSWITLDMAARLSAGRPWPDGAPPVPPADVLLLSAEDGLADTIRPRLDRLGADVSRIHHLAVLRVGEHERAVQLADTAMIEQAIAQTGAKLGIIDPVSAYLGSTDSHRDAEVRGLMAPLAAVADRMGVAIVGVMHLAKSTQRPAIYRAVGSIAFAAAARIVLAVAADPEREERRIVAPIKSNLAAPPAALAFTLTDGRLTWEADPVSDVDVTALLSGPTFPRDREEQADAKQLLRDLLEDDAEVWPLKAEDALEVGKQHGIPERSFRQAARDLGIQVRRLGFGRGGKWLWHRPSIAAELAPMDEDIEKPQLISIAAHRGKESASCRYGAPMENIKENERFPASDAHSGKGDCDDDVL